MAEYQITGKLSDLKPLQSFYSPGSCFWGWRGLVREFLIRASALQFPWLQSDGGCSGSHLKIFFTLVPAVGLSLSWGFLPEDASLCGQTPPSLVSGFQGRQDMEAARFWRLGAWSRCGLSYQYSIGQAVSETRFKERWLRAPPLVERCVQEFGGHI